MPTWDNHNPRAYAVANFSVSMIVAHVQATAVDALRSLGVERGEAQIGDPLALSRCTARDGITIARGSRPSLASTGEEAAGIRPENRASI